MPDKNAEGAWSQRNSHLERIEEIGRRAWLKESGYRQQARAENAFFRWKWMLGDRIRSKHVEAQRREAMIGCGFFNRMFELGKPRYPGGRSVTGSSEGGVVPKPGPCNNAHLGSSSRTGSRARRHG